jgi:hypothetical protein
MHATRFFRSAGLMAKIETVRGSVDSFAFGARFQLRADRKIRKKKTSNNGFSQAAAAATVQNSGTRSSRPLSQPAAVALPAAAQLDSERKK